MGVAERMKIDHPFGSFNRRHRADTAAETESGFTGIPLGFANIKSWSA